MILNFKNSKLKTEYQSAEKTTGMTIKERSDFWHKKNYSEEKMAFAIPIGYVSSLCEVIDDFKDMHEPNVTLDLTYDTVEHLPLMLAQQYFAYVQSGSYTSDKALEILYKTIAAYLMLLCINEHGYILEVQRRKDMDWIFNNIDSDETHVFSWSGYTIKVGDKKKYDLLPEMDKVAKITADGALRIRISRAVEIYKRMCGVDLREKGMNDFEGCV